MPDPMVQFLRQSMTGAERKLWSELRRRQISGWYFRRQAPIGPYIVDFVCHSARLVIEVDGATHSEDHEVAYDQARTAWLESRGYRVLRFNNDDIYTAISGVVDLIWFVLAGEVDPSDEIYWV
jgi:very-short-patch-repair endonuclease